MLAQKDLLDYLDKNMNQLEQIKKESQDEFEEECGLVDMQYRSESDKALDCIARLVDKAYKAGQEAEKERCLKVIKNQKLVEFSQSDAELQEAIKLSLINPINSKE